MPRRQEPGTAASGAERRHLTVMFVDLAGSTAMAERLDPEDMRHVITGYQNNVAGVIARYDGFVAKFMGDGVLCYFGWPRANEDDAERAVRAGLAIIDTVQRTRGPDGQALSCRVGMATGVVIVGDLIGRGATQEAAVVGETPNLAARLQGLAQPGQLVLPRETRSLLGNIFALASLGAHDLKGIAGPVEAFAVLGENAQDSRFEARRVGALTAIVGREQELGLMHECWRRAQAGQGQMILVSGEAGIGKSRITRALIDRIAEDDHARITLQCSPYHTDTAFHPVIQQLSQAAGLEQVDSAGARLDKLERLPGMDRQDAGLLAALLGVDGSVRYGAVSMTPSQQRMRTMQMLIQIIVRQSEARPLLFVFEDLHWIDQTSLELLDTALDAIAGQRVLVLATARPTFQHGFGGHPIVTRFALNRLGREQILAIVAKLTDSRAMPEALLQIIAGRTDGVPLFVEELTKSVLESGILRAEGDRLVLDGPLDALAIPRTLHDSLMARLDRLQPIKEVAQTAACLGREFGHRLLARISPLSGAALAAALDGLVKAELVYRRGVAPDAVYLFKHALVRDAAYESLLKERRRQIHAQILACLETDPDIAAEIRAHHAEAAGLSDRAIELWSQAAITAALMPAYDEAIAQFGHALALLAPAVAAGQRPAMERALDLWVRLGGAKLARRGYGADETRTAFERALALADRIGDTPMRFPVLYGLWVGMYVRGEHAAALLQAEDLLRQAERTDDAGHLAVANRLIGTSSYMMGRFDTAQPYLDRAHARHDPRLHGALMHRFGQDPGVSALCYLALNLWLSGKTRRASALARQLIDDALATGHANTICYAYVHRSFIDVLAGDEDGFVRHRAAMSRLADEHNMTLWHQFSRMGEGLADAGTGDPSALDRYLASDSQYLATGSHVFLPHYRIEAGWRAQALGQTDRGRMLATMAHALIAKTGESVMLADLHRLDAALSRDGGDAAAAEASLRLSLAVAEKQGGRFFALRAANDLAGLWLSQGRAAEAPALLQPILDRIDEGDCAPHRAIAQALLAGRASR
ncbi:MAG: adenylate/guanylate cyclase domain-containing protein [Sneathiellaceae bacterium]